MKEKEMNDAISNRLHYTMKDIEKEMSDGRTLYRVRILCESPNWCELCKLSILTLDF